MNLLQIHYFLAAADCLSFTQAADLLYQTITLRAQSILL